MAASASTCIRRYSCIVFALLTLPCASLGQDLNISNVFGTNMVIQRNRPAPIWGWAAPGANVSVVLKDDNRAIASVSVAANTTGFWRAVLPAQQATFVGHTITASTNGKNVILSNVVFGEVLFTSGQSNMEFTVNAAINATLEVQAANNFPNIRVFSGPEQNLDPLHAATGIFNHTHNELLYTRLNWSVASAQSIGCVDHSCKGWDYFSAVAWFAARDLYITLNSSVPVGAISQNYGGTSIQFWMSADAIHDSNAPIATQCCGMDGGPSCLYNTQVYPYTLGPMQFSAVLWYQGEQNANCGGPTQVAGAVYSTMLQTMVEDWRSKLNQPTLAFGAVLLAAWQNPKDLTSFPYLRLSQVNLTIVSNTFLISAIDRGDPSSGAVHSPYKQDVGHRAAMGVASVALGIDNEPFLGPQFYTSQVSKTSPPNVEIAFAPRGLYSKPLLLNSSVGCPPKISVTSCEAFAVMSNDCVWHPAVATLDSDSTGLLLTPSNWTNVGAPAVATRGYFANWPVVTITNAFGTPLVPWLEPISGVASNCQLGPPPPPPPPPPTPPCNSSTVAPSGFTEMKEQGWWLNYTRISLNSHQGVDTCAAACEAHGSTCAAFHVWEPCTSGDCYLYLENNVSGFSQHMNSFAYLRITK